MIRTGNFSSIRISLCVGLLMVAGCRTEAPPGAFEDYPRGPKFHLKVAVCITDDLRQTKSEVNGSIPIGKSISEDAPALAQSVFTDVAVVNSRSSLPDIDAVLTPKIAYVGRTHGATSGGESIMDVKIEWELKTPDGKLIWVETTDGQDSVSTGKADSTHMLRNAVEEMLLNTQSAMLSSDAIKQFAERRP